VALVAGLRCLEFGVSARPRGYRVLKYLTRWSLWCSKGVAPTGGCGSRRTEVKPRWHLRYRSMAVGGSDRVSVGHRDGARWSARRGVQHEGGLSPSSRARCYVLPKGGYQQLHAAGLEPFRNGIITTVPWLSGRTDELREWSQFSLLSVESDRLHAGIAQGCC
jgi:hypothetical protein